MHVCTSRVIVTTNLKYLPYFKQKPNDARWIVKERKAKGNIMTFYFYMFLWLCYLIIGILIGNCYRPMVRKRQDITFQTPGITSFLWKFPGLLSLGRSFWNYLSPELQLEHSTKRPITHYCLCVMHRASVTVHRGRNTKISGFKPWQMIYFVCFSPFSAMHQLQVWVKINFKMINTGPVLGCGKC